MTDSSTAVRAAEPGELDRLAALLEANDLPSQGLRASPGQFFVVRADGTVVGGGGVELYGSNALVRSVVVAESHRGKGYGSALCDAIETRALEADVTALYLLTTTAAGFFRARGFEVTGRDDLPERIRETTLVANRCPVSATCMRKSID